MRFRSNGYFNINDCACQCKINRFFGKAIIMYVLVGEKKRKELVGVGLR